MPQRSPHSPSAAACGWSATRPFATRRNGRWHLEHALGPLGHDLDAHQGLRARQPARGWVSGSEAALARCAEAQNALSVEPAGPSLALASALAPHLDALRARARAILSTNHALWRSLVASGLPCDASVPSQGTTVFVHFPGPAGGDVFAAFAAERFRLLVVPGRFFGEPRGARIALGGEPAVAPRRSTPS